MIYEHLCFHILQKQGALFVLYLSVNNVYFYMLTMSLFASQGQVWDSHPSK